MKKHILAAAVAVAISAPAMAQTVTLFGVADVGYRTAKFTDAGALRAQASGIADGAMAGNRFGFRGTEDLGGGLKVGFVIEHGISLVSHGLTDQRQGNSNLPVQSNLADSGRTLGVNRQSFLSIAGGMGELRAGYQYTNLYEVSTLSGFNLGSEGTHGADTAHTMAGIAGGSRANGVTYLSPTINNFQVALQYGGTTDQNKYASTGTNASLLSNSYTTGVAGTTAGYDVNRTSARLKYQTGPLHIQGAITKLSSKTSAAGSTNYGAATKSELTQIGASYNAGFATFAGTYGTGKPTEGTNKNTGYQIGARFPMGAMAFIVAAGNYTVENLTGANPTQNDMAQTQIGLNYTLSKRTTAYMYSGETKDTGAAAAAIDKKSATIIGVLHTF